jgi:hypothetical protein
VCVTIGLLMETLRRALLGAAMVLLGWGVFVTLTGGIDTQLAGVAIRSRDPFRALTISLALFVILATRFRTATLHDSDRAAAVLRRAAPWLAAGAACLLVLHAVLFGTFAAGGSDSYGYLSEAYAWARGELPLPLPLPLTLPFPSADLIQIPLAYRLGQQPHTMVPVVAPGLPLMMAAALAVGSCGPFLVVPACAALLVWTTFLFGRRAGGPTAGVTAAIAIAASPIVLFQSLVPMSDIPAAAFWTAAAAASLRGSRRGACLAGACSAAGLLIRPNLLPLAAGLFITVALAARGRERAIRLALFCIAIIPAPLVLGTLNTMWYGAPWNSGYGNAGQLYSMAHVRANLGHYSSWLWESQSPWVLLALVPLLPVFGRRVDRGAIRLAILMIATTLGCYIAYAPFDAWWYLRFMLPGMGAVAVLIGAGAVAIARSVPRPWGRLAAAVMLWIFVVKGMSFATRAGVFGQLKANERRYVDIGEFVGRTLPENAIVLSGQHSGSVRFYGGRLTARYEWVDKEWASRTPAEFERVGLHPYMVIDDWEAPLVRAQFGLPADTPLPWPAIAHRREQVVTVFDLATHPEPAHLVSIVPGSGHLCAPGRPLAGTRRRQRDRP